MGIYISLWTQALRNRKDKNSGKGNQEISLVYSRRNYESWERLSADTKIIRKNYFLISAALLL